MTVVEALVMVVAVVIEAVWQRGVVLSIKERGEEKVVESSVS